MRNGVYMTMVAIMCGIASFLFVLEIDDEEVKAHDKRRK